MSDRIRRVSASMHGEWIHCDKDCTEDEIVKFIYSAMQKAIKLCEEVIDMGMTISEELVKQRIYGGFKCDAGGFHIFHDLDAYVYSKPNQDLTPEQRRRIWDILIETNKDAPFTKGAPFTSDYPGYKEK